MRCSTINRETKETKIYMELNLDGTGKSEISTGIGFLDHMLTHIAKLGFIDLIVKAEGDLNVDCHHTIEDIGIVFGKCLLEAMGDKVSMNRYGDCILPMEDALILCALDISGRPFLSFDCDFSMERLGDFDTEMFEEFFRAVCIHAGFNLHIKCMDGKNNHHVAEACFKAFGKVLDEATTINTRITGVLSTKGMLEL